MDYREDIEHLRQRPVADPALRFSRRDAAAPAVTEDLRVAA
jgi:hypothetical protein